MRDERHILFYDGTCGICIRSVRFILKNESEQMPDYMKYISTHPETEERLKNINSKKESKLVFTENVQLKRAFEKMKSHLD